MKYVEAPNTYTPTVDERAIFLAGDTSTGVPNWQSAMRVLLSDQEIVLFNPRRRLGISSEMIPEQSAWEFTHVRLSETVIFWFPEESQRGMPLYLLGTCTVGSTNLAIGVHRNYRHRREIEADVSLVLPALVIAYSLQELVEQTKAKGWVTPTPGGGSVIEEIVNTPPPVPPLPPLI